MVKQFKKVGTHSGRFHADEVMSTALLKELFEIEVVRSRDPDILNQLDLVYDVGEGEFDHHQMEKKYRENGTPYAACGLIWDRFGREIIREHDMTLLEEDIDYIFYKIDAMLIEGIDAADNGLRTTRTIIPTLNISAIIAKFNPTWDSEVDEDGAFFEAVQLASVVFTNMLKQKISVAKARSPVQKAYNSRTVPEILLLDKSYPWNDLLYEVDKENELRYVIYPDHNQYMIQIVRRHNGKYENMKSLPRSWAGKRDAELSDIVGVGDAVFCHTDRFIAGAKSLESALKMAELAIAEPEEPVSEREVRFLDALKKFLLSKRFRILR